MWTKWSSGAPLPALVTAAGWLVPGAGYWMLGQRARGTTIGLTILLLFLGGMLVGGGHVVDPPDPFEGNLARQLLRNPLYVAQIMTGPLAIYSGWLAEVRDWPRSHWPVADLGALYTAVAGMLNLLAIIDSTYRAAQRKAGR